MKIVHITRQKVNGKKYAHQVRIPGFQTNTYPKEPDFPGDTLSMIKTDIESLLELIEEKVDLNKTIDKNP